jgi:hypothetical protein
LVGPGTYDVDTTISIKKSIMLTGTGELETVLDATEYSSTNHVIALVNGKDLTLRNISLLGNEQLLGIRCGSTTIVNNLEVTDCKFDGFKTPIYLNEKI